MSVVAWDGRTLAADRQSSSYGTLATVTKLFQIDERTVVAVVGYARHIGDLIDWARKGFQDDTFPKECVSGEHASCLIVARDNGCVFYNQSAWPQEVEDAFWAWGSGGDTAIGAMAMGADAVRAVEIASEWSEGCGRGIDFGVAGAAVVVNKTKLPNTTQAKYARSPFSYVERMAAQPFKRIGDHALDATGMVSGVEIQVDGPLKVGESTPAQILRDGKVVSRGVMQFEPSKRVSESNLQLNVPASMLDTASIVEAFEKQEPASVEMVDEFASDGLRSVWVHPKGVLPSSGP